MSDIEDEEMAAAIAASLETFQQQESRKSRLEDRIDDDDDDAESKFQADLRKALEASKAETGTKSTKNGAGITDVPPPGDAAAATSDPASEFLRQRALLEKQRLARNRGQFGPLSSAARSSASASGHRRSGSGGGQKRSHSASQSDEEDEGSDGPPPKRKVASGSNSIQPPGPSDNDTSKREGELFYDHELRQTANWITEAQDRRNGTKTFRISDVIGDKKELTFAILSSYCTDVSWLYSFFDPKTPVILVSPPRDEGNTEIHNILPNWVMTMPFLRGGRGAMHVKLMLLFYKSGRLRVVIPTANFFDYDWRDIENSVWVQDFPLLAKSIVGRDANATAFSNTLQMVLKRLNVPAALETIKLEHADLPFSRVEELGKRWKFGNAKVKLIPSMSGKHVGWDQVLMQGHVALMKGVVDIGAHVGQAKRKAKPGSVELSIECQGSSIGTYSAQWLQEFYSSCSGISPETWLDKSKAARARLPVPPIKILFPSLRTVQASALGTAGAGTMFCRRNQWDGSTFPRGLFHDSNSKRGGVLMHTKMILGLWRPKTSALGRVAMIPDKKGRRGSPIVLNSDEEGEGENSDDEIQLVEPEAAGWLYVGSHNFTPSAWGNLSGTAFTPELNITNYELGVLIPLSAKPDEAEKEGDAMASWVRPPRKYNLAPGGDEPWIQ